LVTATVAGRRCYAFSISLKSRNSQLALGSPYAGERDLVRLYVLVLSLATTAVTKRPVRPTASSTKEEGSLSATTTGLGGLGFGLKRYIKFKYPMLFDLKDTDLIALAVLPNQFEDTWPCGPHKSAIDPIFGLYVTLLATQGMQKLKRTPTANTSWQKRRLDIN